MPRKTRAQREQEEQAEQALFRIAEDERLRQLPGTLLGLMALAHEAGIGSQSRNIDGRLTVSFYSSQYDPVSDRHDVYIDEVLDLASPAWQVDSIRHSLQAVIDRRLEEARMLSIAEQAWQQKLTEEERSAISRFHKQLR